MTKTLQQIGRFILFSCIATLSSLSAAAEPIRVVATFSIIGDITQQVGGDRVKVQSLVGADADAHVFQPSPKDARALAEARLVVSNGLGFEGWIERLIKSSGYRGPVVKASDGVQTQRLEHDDHDSHGQGIDPHAWQNVENVVRYVDNIQTALATVDPQGAATYRANADRYKQELAKLHAEIRQTFASLPAERRKVVTTHDAFGYFSHAYGVAFIAPLGVNTEAEPSAADIGRIIKQIRRERIPAVFLETISDPRLLERIRQESGARVGGTLYSDALSATTGPAPTYLKMMRYNASTIAKALAE